MGIERIKCTRRKVAVRGILRSISFEICLALTTSEFSTVLDFGVLILIILNSHHVRVLMQKHGWVQWSTAPVDTSVSTGYNLSTLLVDKVQGDKQ